MKIVLLIIISFFLSGCNQKVIEDNTLNFLKPKITEVEVYSDITIEDVIDVLEDVKVINKDKTIDTTKLGKQEIMVNYEYENKLYVYKQDLVIKDTTPPLVFSGTNKTVDLNYSKDLCDLITYGDNYSGDVQCTISGVYDLTKEGTYNLVYTLKDSSQNIKEVNVTLNVSEPKPSSGSTTPKKQTEFKDIYKLHKQDNVMIGIDVSKWQGVIDFAKVKEAGAEFVMIRLAHQGSSMKELTLDEYFKNNLRKAKEAGLQVGIYLYSIATSKEEAIAQADFVIEALENTPLDLPIAFDWESWSKWNSFKISFYEINEIANAFMERIKEAGYDAMLYSSKFYLEKIWTNKKDFPVWLAHYTTKTNYAGQYNIWQLCNNGHIDGIISDVDIDILYK